MKTAAMLPHGRFWDTRIENATKKARSAHETLDGLIGSKISHP